MTTLFKNVTLLTALSLSLVFGLTGCDRRTVGATTGAAVGGITGAALGGKTGAVVGGVAGAAVGSAVTSRRYRHYH
ncbi:hypothetical protein [Coxiella burnetii]|uniref:Hypothetical membrane associated protein n=2 Tax=Coxiella burnetii TaxID=777 RepID=Q83EF3_COXBU|nr:hypothetical protein [Coxiella burnetii]NP_819410.1 membrane-associated protein [Coxiella burnetii RSA 493]AAO89924.1 hypothetical membrane associated protein [Coxiella burnetii RSA 493]ABS76713.1 hypothetical membrane associated protein [Coxiella burnetii Dugway 5J108-111]ABX77711.1 putative surface antigen [Coxiella burnetii RSA 331]ACJ18922.1 hypothetical membrane-associated protein [Coxiella burnetii CbuG_Q212]AIT62856.1 hypothetical protein CBNA_0529 [Coxiella burnetii str. Namibia]